jgi:hypothetical protein
MSIEQQWTAAIFSGDRVVVISHVSLGAGFVKYVIALT